MDLALIFSAFMLGLAGTPHCAAMCGAPCAAVVGRGGAGSLAPSLSFHLARVAGYAAVGGLAAAGLGVMAVAGQAAPIVRPLWALLHMAALALGLWLLITGRQPAFMTRIGRTRGPAAASQAAGGPSGSGYPAAAAAAAAAGSTAASSGGTWQAMSTPWTAAAAGAVWVAWPCGLLQSALVVAALANTPSAGAAAMAAFAMASAIGLQAAPWVAARLGRWGGRSAALAVRVAGAALAIGSGWALGHDLWVRVADYCAT